MTPNEKSSDDEDCDAPVELVDDSWLQLLIKDEDEAYSLKPWNQVHNARKLDLAKALRQYMRQAWSK